MSKSTTLNPHLPSTHSLNSTTTTTSFYPSHDFQVATIAGRKLTRYQARTILQYLYFIQSSTATALHHLDKLEKAKWPVPHPSSLRGPFIVLADALVQADLVVAQQMSITGTLLKMITLPYYPVEKEDSGLFVNPALLYNELQKLCDWFSRHHAVPDKRADREVKILKFLQTWYVVDFLPPLILLADVLEGAVKDSKYWKLPPDTETVERIVKNQPGDGVDFGYKQNLPLTRPQKPKPKTLAEYAEEYAEELG